MIIRRMEQKDCFSVAHVVTIAWNDDYGKSYLTKVKTYIDELNKIYSGLTIEYKCMSNLFNSFETVDKEIQNIINRTTGI